MQPAKMPLSKGERRHKQDVQIATKALREMSGKACTLLIARHGETDWNLEHRC